MVDYQGHIAGATVFGGGYLAILAYAFSVDAANLGPRGDAAGVEYPRGWTHS